MSLINLRWSAKVPFVNLFLMIVLNVCHHSTNHSLSNQMFDIVWFDNNPEIKSKYHSLSSLY